MSGRGHGRYFQQVQTHERGANRVTASSLARVAKALEMPVAALFDNEPDAASNLFSAIGAPGAADTPGDAASRDLSLTSNLGIAQIATRRMVP